jgi:hypothetical protein
MDALPNMSVKDRSMIWNSCVGVPEACASCS